MPGTASTGGGTGPLPSSHAATLLYASLALFRTTARYSVDSTVAPSASIAMSTTRDVPGLRRSPATSESVDSRSGSIGKMTAGVYTDVVLWRAWSSIAPPDSTVPSTSAIATRMRVVPFGPGADTLSWSRSRESSLSIEHHNRSRRSRAAPVGASEGCAWSASAIAAGEKSGTSP